MRTFTLVSEPGLGAVPIKIVHHAEYADIVATWIPGDEFPGEAAYEVFEGGPGVVAVYFENGYPPGSWNDAVWNSPDFEETEAERKWRQEQAARAEEERIEMQAELAEKERKEIQKALAEKEKREAQGCSCVYASDNPSGPWWRNQRLVEPRRDCPLHSHMALEAERAAQERARREKEQAKLARKRARNRRAHNWFIALVVLFFIAALAVALPLDEVGTIAGISNSGSSQSKAQVAQAVEDYYTAVDREGWAYTYKNLDSQTQAMFTKKEWHLKNQYFADTEGLELSSMEVQVNGSVSDPVVPVTVHRIFEDGTTLTRDTLFVFEDGAWKHRFTEEENGFFMPGTPFGQFVAAQQ